MQSCVQVESLDGRICRCRRDGRGKSGACLRESLDGGLRRQAKQIRGGVHRHCSQWLPISTQNASFRRVIRLTLLAHSLHEGRSTVNSSFGWFALRGEMQTIPIDFAYTDVYSVQSTQGGEQRFINSQVQFLFSRPNYRSER